MSKKKQQTSSKAPLTPEQEAKAKASYQKTRRNIWIFAGVLILVLLVLFLLLQLCEAQILAGLFVSRIAPQGILVMLNRRSVILTFVSHVASVVACGLSQSLVGICCYFGKHLVGSAHQ